MWCLYSCSDQLCRLLSDGCQAVMLSSARWASAALCSDAALVGVVKSLERLWSGGNSVWMDGEEEVVAAVDVCPVLSDIV